MSARAKKVIKTTIDVLIGLLFISSVIITVLVINSRQNGTASLFSLKLLTVQTDSMEPLLSEGDMIIGREAAADEVFSVGDVITFEAVIDGEHAYNTHRISRTEVINGILCYHTKGDNADSEDEDYIVADQIISRYINIRIPRVGKVFNFLQTKSGIFFCLLLPMLIFLIYQSIAFIRNLISYNKEKLIASGEAQTQLTAEQKKKIAEEYLAAQDEARQDENTSENDKPQ